MRAPTLHGGPQRGRIDTSTMKYVAQEGLMTTLG
jgi:hypothetical protein